MEGDRLFLSPSQCPKPHKKPVLAFAPIQLATLTSDPEVNKLPAEKPVGWSGKYQLLAAMGLPAVNFGEEVGGIDSQLEYWKEVWDNGQTLVR